MNKFTYSNNKQSPQHISRKGKIKSLEALEEALFNEEYERCAELINSAKNLGAEAVEIQKILSSYTSNMVKKEGFKRHSVRF